MISLERAKLNCRVDDDDEDDLFRMWIKEAELVIQNDLDLKIISSTDEKVNESDLMDNEWLDSARLIYVQYRHSRSELGKPQAYWDLLQKFRVMGL